VIEVEEDGEDEYREGEEAEEIFYETEDSVIEPTPIQRQRNSRQIPGLSRSEPQNMPQARQNRSRQNMEVRQRETRQEQNARATSAVRTQPLSPERTPEPHRRQNRFTPSR
jgi:hypothetical protein